MQIQHAQLEDVYRSDGAVLGIGGHRSYGHHIFQTFDNSAKYGIAAVQMRLWSQCNVVLAPCAVWSGCARHCQHSGTVVQEIGMKLILDIVSGPARSCAIGTSILDHKAFDHPMEDQIVVKTIVGKISKIECCDGDQFVIQLRAKTAQRSVPTGKYAPLRQHRYQYNCHYAKQSKCKFHYRLQNICIHYLFAQKAIKQFRSIFFVRIQP